MHEIKLPLSYQQIARVAHEINAAYCRSHGDYSQPTWSDAPPWLRDSAVCGVRFHVAIPDASTSASHDNWLKDKLADGWVYGAVKDPTAKTHPCCVAYDQLPAEQKEKYFLFKQVVHSLTNLQVANQNTTYQALNCAFFGFKDDELSSTANRCIDPFMLLDVS